MRSRPSGRRELSVQSAGLDSPSTLGQGHRPGRAPRGRWGRLARGALVFVTVLSLAAAAISGYARYELADERAFATRAASALENEQVRAALASRLVDAFTNNVTPNVLIVRPLLLPAVSAVAETSQFRRLFELVVRARHRALFEGGSGFVFDLDRAGGALVDAIRAVSPRAARAISPDRRLRITTLEPRSFELVATHAIGDLARWWWPLLGVSLLCLAACALAAGGLRPALAFVGASVAAAGLTVAGVVTVAGLLVASHAGTVGDDGGDLARSAVTGLWDALFADLHTAALVASVAGALVAGLASAERVGYGLTGARAWLDTAVRSPSRGARIGRAVVLALIGAALLLQPTLTLRAIAAVLALLLLAVAVTQFGAPAPAGVAAASRPAGGFTPVAAGISAAVLVAATVVVALVLPGPGAAPAESAAPGSGCNGSPALCRRRLNEVAFAGTHNSYAAADEPGWYFASQRFGIERQLRDGIRAFLIDVHYGVPEPRSGRIRTDLAYEGSSRNKVARELSPEALRLAERLAPTIGRDVPDGPRGIYLCHTLCELGAEPLTEQLRLIERFTADNPREVIVLFVEPYVPPREIGKALREADLRDRVAEISRDEPLPTLGELVRAGTPIVILAEQDGGARPWYLDGFSFAQDTPLGATRPSQLRCGRYRGSADSPLFLVNHWIPPFPPSVTRNQRIGGRYLERRLTSCGRRRELVPNLVAVDFYERSGVVDVVRRRNAAG